ncbi:TIGR03757 family integrating conjugative element protein [Pantoea agglomerans]|uniref:TIGR03757 family integrating conjugative element protein n=1 Tax=Enterobacter agglomerans TaxID=549 RepID=UPI0025431A44|nr:TIGR03757 family integrating conjugative element protein [Pantoea agglomerans]MDK4219036.1 TIGR03757 family integrating conjugative element protein [Pantoea agglomerans]
MRIRTLLFFSLLIPIQVMAGTVVFTDAQHPPLNLTADTEVVWMDGPDRLQQAIFGDLSSDPQQAALQAQQVIQSPDWPRKQAQIAGAYRQVVHAWEIGLHKYPAVVFDDRDVVYGTADVAQASLHRTQGAG